MSTAFNANRIIDGENTAQTFLPIKQIYSERKHTVRKQALGEIKNVIHNQSSSITPFKGVQQMPSKSIFSDFLKKRTEQIRSKIDDHPRCEQVVQQQRIGPITSRDSEDVVERRELPAPRTCDARCHKSLGEIWSEMNVLDPDTLERLVNGNGDLDDDYDYDISARNTTPIDFDDDFDLAFDLHDPFETDENKLLEDLLAEDYGRPELPSVLDWMDDL